MKKSISLWPVLALTGLLPVFPQAYAGAVRDGLRLCAESVIPSLFPFFVAVPLLLELGLASRLQSLCAPVMGPLFSLSGACALPLLAGLVGGYPSGAKAAADLWRRGEISREEAERLLGMCNNCGPGFILGYAAQHLGEPGLGLRLWGIHVLSALAAGIILCRGRRKALPPRSRPLPAVSKPFAQALTAAVSGAVNTTLTVCAWIVLFRVLAALLPLPGWSMGAMELVSGVAALPSGRIGFAAASAMLAWGGVCVHCQAMAAADGLGMRQHLRGKLLQALLAAALAWCLY